MTSALALPKRAPGRKSVERAAAEHAADIAFAGFLEAEWRRTGLAFGARGWCYAAEGIGIIDKSQFGCFEAIIGRLRKDGILNPDVVSDDDSRVAENVEFVDEDNPGKIAKWARDRAREELDSYTPTSRWNGLDTYCEVMVEKVDLKLLFRAVCQRYGVPLINGKGSTDINSRRRMLQRFSKHHRAGRDVVLLYCGDFDPAGLRISDVIKSNLMECANVQDVRFDPTPVQVERFGLNRDQVEALGLTWIDNLITGSGADLGSPKHPDHFKPYVQTWIATHGRRKVEANALARDPGAAGVLVEQAINRFVPPDWPQRHDERLRPYREEACAAFEALIVEEGI